MTEAINKGENFTQKKVRTGDGGIETWKKSILKLNVSWGKGVAPVHGFCGSEIYSVPASPLSQEHIVL